MVRVEPVAEQLELKARDIAEKVSGVMGIGFRNGFDIHIHDTPGYFDEHRKRGYPEPEAEFGLALPRENLVLIDGGRLFSKGIGPDADVGVLETDLLLGVACMVPHELAHLFHSWHDSRIFTRMEKAREVFGKGGQAAAQALLSNPYEMIFALRMDKTLSEGIAIYAENAVWASYGGKNRAKELTLVERARIFFDLASYLELYDLGAWFMNRIEGLLGGNPVKIVIENPPSNPVELLSPQIYAARLRWCGI